MVPPLQGLLRSRRDGALPPERSQWGQNRRTQDHFEKFVVLLPETSHPAATGRIPICSARVCLIALGTGIHPSLESE